MCGDRQLGIEVYIFVNVFLIQTEAAHYGQEDITPLGDLVRYISASLAT